MEQSTIKKYLPWVVATALFMEQLDSTIVNTAVPSIAASLQVSPLSLKGVVASYILSLAVGYPSVDGWQTALEPGAYLPGRWRCSHSRLCSAGSPSMSPCWLQHAFCRAWEPP